MKIKCKNCGHTEKVSLSWAVNIVGLLTSGGGFYLWVTYALAGTGLAIEIVTALVLGGPAIIIFKKEIIEWITKMGYKCPVCRSADWEAIDD